MLIFSGWRKFFAFYNRANVKRFVQDAAETSEDVFRDGVESGPKTGRIYRRRRGFHQASVNRAGAEYPANDTGALAKSIKSTATATEATVGSAMYYAIFLRNGTSRMQRRKMSDTALQTALPTVRSRMKAFAEWKR